MSRMSRAFGSVPQASPAGLVRRLKARYALSADGTAVPGRVITRAVAAEIIEARAVE